MELETNHELGRKIMRKGLGQYLFFLFLAPAGYVIKLLLTNALSVADVWLLYGIINVLGLISMYNDLGLSDCLQYFIPQYLTNKDPKRVYSLITFTFFFQFVTGVFIVLALYFGADRIATNYFSTPIAADLLRIFCIYFGFFNLLQVTTNIFVAYQKPVYQNITETVRMSSIILTIVWFARFAEVDVVAGAYAWIVGAACAMLTAMILFVLHYRNAFRWLSCHRQLADIRQWFGYAIWAFVWANIGMLYSQVDQLLLLGMWGTEIAGYYTAYQALATIAFTVLTPLATLIFPIMRQMISEQDTHKLYALLRVLYTFFFMMGMFFVILFTSFWVEIATTLFGQKFAYSGHLIQVWALLQLLAGLNRVTLMLYAARGSVKQRVQLVAEGLLINCICVVFGYMVLSMYGVLLWLGIWLLYVLIRSQLTLHYTRKYPYFFQRQILRKNFLVWIGIIILVMNLKTIIPFPSSRLLGGMSIMIRSCLILFLMAIMNFAYLRHGVMLINKSLTSNKQ